MSGPRGSDPTQWRPPRGAPYERRQLPPQEETRQAPQPQQQPWWMEKPDRLPTQRQPRPQPPPAPNYYAPQQNPQYQPPPAYPSSPPVYYPQQVDAAPRKRSKGPLLISGALLVVLIAAAALFGAWKLGAFNGNELDVKKAQADVRQILTDPINGYGAQNVSDVKCNNGRNPKAKKGGSFTCEVTVDGAKRNVKVVFEDDDGTFLVDRPR